MKWIKRLGKLLLLLYIILCIVLYAIQTKLIFNPEVLPESHNYRMGKEIEIPLTDEISMNSVLIKTPNPKGVILYYHSNRNCIRFAIYQTRQLLDHGYDIFIPDYRGYGKTEGVIDSEKTFYEDAQKAYDYLKTQYREDQIVLFGYSLGTAPATYIASKNNPKHLALVAPFSSLIDVKNDFMWFMPDFLLRFKFRSEKYMAEVKCPITIFHGAQDQVISIVHGKRLAAIHPDRTQLVVAKNKNHRGIIFDSRIGKLFSNL